MTEKNSHLLLLIFFLLFAPAEPGRTTKEGRNKMNIEQRSQMDALFVAHYNPQRREARIPWPSVAAVFGVDGNISIPNDATLCLLTKALGRPGMHLLIETILHPNQREYYITFWQN